MRSLQALPEIQRRPVEIAGAAADDADLCLRPGMPGNDARHRRDLLRL
jgi:hypothetical protein